MVKTTFRIATTVEITWQNKWVKKEEKKKKKEKNQERGVHFPFPPEFSLFSVVFYAAQTIEAENEE